MILDRLLKRDLKLSDPKAWNTALWNLSGSDTYTGKSVTEDNALYQTAVFGCIRILGETVGSLPLMLYRRRQDGGKDRADNDDRYWLLHNQPNPEMTAMSYREAITVHLNTWGNHYSEKEIDTAGRIKALWPLNPSCMSPERAPNGELVYRYKIQSTGEEYVWPREKVLHIPGLGFNGLMGYSPIYMARQAIALAGATEEFGARFFGNNARPSGVLQTPNPLDDDAYDRLKKSWESSHQGLDNSHRIAILEEGVTFEAIGIPPEEAQWLESQKYQDTKIARIYRVPPHMLADLDRATFSNITDQTLSFVKYTITPWLIRIEQCLNSQLLLSTEQRKLFFEHLVDGLLRGDPKARSDYYKGQFGIGDLSINEIRALENRNPVEGGDQRFVPLNMVPLNMAQQLQQPDEEEPPGNDDEDEETDDVRTFFRHMTARASLANRTRIQNAHRILFKENAGRIVRAEVAKIKKAVKSRLLPRGVDDFEEWLEDFYKDQEQKIIRDMHPLFLAFAQAISGAAYEEIGQEPEWNAEMDEFVRQYTENYASRHIFSSQGQIQALLREYELEQAAEAIEKRTDEWEDRRPDKIAENETVRGNNAVARFVFIAAGITKLIWINQSNGPCPYCEELDGKVVGIDRPFVSAGDFKPKGAEPMKIRGNHFHPPLHEGCQCAIRAE